MSRFRRSLVGMLVLCLVLSLGGMDTSAAGYTYTITFYPGNHGSFQGLSQVSVDNSKSGSAYQVNGGGSKITVSGLRRDDVVSFDAAMAGAVALSGDSKYYVRGIRQSGRDNSTVASSAFRVTEDQDYVVAYGISGELTSYVVHYQDASGRTLAPSRTSYGNVGDQPVIAFVYIEGYQPQAYNLTKTLSANEAENVFTFVYTRVRGTGGGSGSGSGTTGTGGSAADAGTGATDGTTDQTAQTAAGTGGNAAGAAQGGAGAAGGAGANATGGADAAGAGEIGGAGDNIAGGAEDAQTSEGGEDNAEQEPEEIINLDDEETPLGNFNGNENPGMLSPFGIPLAVWIALLIAALIAVGIGVRYRLAGTKKREKKEEDAQ